MASEFKLLSIDLYNIFNYRGKHRIDFNTSRDGNIFLFDIKNGGGKTSLFLSIKWGFYGFDSGIKYEKDGLFLNSTNFINQDELDEGSFRVLISFTYDGKQMELRRECPNYKSNLTKLTLKVDGMMHTGDDAKKLVHQIIPPDYGDFFMFNGEVLNDIASNQKDAMKIDGVLKLLGLKQLNDLRDIIFGIKEDLKKQNTNIIIGSASSAIQTSIQKKIGELDRARADLSKNKAELDEITSDLAILEESRRTYSDTEGLINKISDCKRQIAELEGKKKGIINAIGNNSPNSYLLFVEQDIHSLKKKYSDEQKELKGYTRTSKGVPNEFAKVQNDIIAQHITECPVCRSVLSDEQLSIIKQLLDEASFDDEKYRSRRNRISELSGLINVLDEGLDVLPLKLNNLCNDLFNTCEDIAKKQAELDNLNEMASHSQVDALREVTDQIISLSKRKKDVAPLVNHLTRMVDAGEKALEKLEREYAKETQLDSNQRKVSDRFEYVSKLLANLDKVIREVKLRKREDILNKANEVFMNITNKPDVYSGLSYDDDKSFSMHIVRKDGRRVMLPSSGEKHVLAISFLVSLSLNTERLNPMMMDTPLSRLDVEHKMNIGKALSKLDNQILFLAQPGELDDVTRKSFMPSVAKMFESRPDEDNVACIWEVPL